MTQILNLKTITQFGKNYSSKICNDYFTNKLEITGNEILGLTPSKQINLLVIKQLFENWTKDAETFKSPYFDFENEKVKAALIELMNVASQNIFIKKADFEPLLAIAASNTLKLTLEPKTYFIEEITNIDTENVTIENLKSIQKYTKVHATVASILVDNAGKNKSIKSSKVIDWINELNIIDHDIEDQLAILDVKKEDFYQKADEKTETKSFFETESNEITTKDVLPKKTILIEPEVALVSDEKETIPGTLNHSYASESPSINDALKDEKSTLIDLHQHSPVVALAESISLNQKFIFMNKLFEGDSNAFNETIKTFENCASFDEVNELVQYKLTPKYHWKMNSDEAEEFIDIVKRKFIG